MPQKPLFAYATNNGSNNVSVIDAVTNTVVATISVGIAPNGIAFTPNGKRAYVANWSSNNVSVIDTVTKAVVGTPIPVSAPRDCHHAGRTTRLVTSEPNTVLVIDTASNTILGTPIPVGIGPSWVAITPDVKHAYVTNTGAGIVSTVSVIRTATNKVVATVPVGEEPYGIAISPNGKRAYVANQISNPGTVSVIDTSNNKVVATITTGPPPSVPLLVSPLLRTGNTLMSQTKARRPAQSR